MSHDVVQGFLLMMSGTAVWLLAGKNEKRQLIGCIIGVCGQPLWLWSTWIYGQWGIFILALVFLYSYGKGAIVRMPWRKHGRLRRWFSSGGSSRGGT